MSEKAKTTEAGQIDQTGWWVLFATISASSMAFIGGSALNVALPAIQEALDASGADLLWIINAFNLFLAALLLLGGSLGDHYGRKRVYMIGIVVFIGATIASGFAPNPDILIAARVIQGIGGALMVPGSLAIVSAYFDSNTRGKAIGIWSSVTTLTSIAGPVLGGFLAESGLWRAIFFINIPLAIAALWALRTHVPESYDENATEHFDYIGAVLVTLGMTGITYGAISIGEVGVAGFQRWDLMGSLIAGFALLAGFIVWEGRSREPMMPLRLFQSRTFLGANLLTLFLYGGLGGALYFFPLNLIQIQGYGETLAGFALIPMSLLLVVLSPRMGAVVDRYGPRLPLVVGPIIAGIGFIALSIPGVTNGPSDYWLTYFPGIVIFGIGMGITVAPLTTSVMGSVSNTMAGIASGVNNAMSRSSQVLALSILGGLGLIIFMNALTPDINALDIPEETRMAIIASGNDLGGMAIPEDLNEENSQAVRRAIQDSFVTMYRFAMLVGAALSFISAALAFIYVEEELVQDSRKSNE